tara:strand:- start:248 stop:982 length:735 start_codon:yes stop_codon:yes gene_type:complete
MRLQKYLASIGYGSRRKIEEWIRDKRIKVNGKVIDLGYKVKKNDKISLDHKQIISKKINHTHKHIIYNKQDDEICTRHDEKKRKTVFESLPNLSNQRWISVGRLDMTTTGLLIFTTDGDLANRLMHPSSGIIREYVVRIFGNPTNDEINTLKKGVCLDDGMARFNSINKVSKKKKLNPWYKVAISEGRNHEIKRMWSKIGYKVNRLIRVSYGPIVLPRTLEKGKYSHLGDEGTQDLYDCVNVFR